MKKEQNMLMHTPYTYRNEVMDQYQDCSLYSEDFKDGSKAVISELSTAVKQHCESVNLQFEDDEDARGSLVSITRNYNESADIKNAF
jgi:hypothetical protein